MGELTTGSHRIQSSSYQSPSRRANRQHEFRATTGLNPPNKTYQLSLHVINHFPGDEIGEALFKGRRHNVNHFLQCFLLPSERDTQATEIDIMASFYKLQALFTHT